jgi:hypothetical protein
LCRHFYSISEKRSFLQNDVYTKLFTPSVLIRDGFSSSTEAFSSNSLGYNKPFLRYNQVVNDSEIIWDLWNERIIDPMQFTFSDHLSTLHEIAIASGSKDIANLINKFESI